MSGKALKSINRPIDNHALDSKSLPKKLKILNWGENVTNDGSVFLNDKTMDVFIENQLKTGRDKSVAIDFDHNTVVGSKEYIKGEPKKIAGYGDPEIVAGDGLYLNNIEWTPLGEENARNYKDLSPAAIVKNDGTVIGLDSVGLTPHGAVYNLSFYSADKGINDMMNKMSSDKPKKEGLAFDADSDSYNKDGANAGVKKVGDEFKLNLDSDEADEADEVPMTADENGITHVVACKCAKCSADKKQSIKNMNADLTGKDNFKKPRIMPDGYQSIPNNYKKMNDTIIKEMAAIAGVDGETDQDKVLFAFLAVFKGLQEENKDLINTKDKSDEGGLKQFSADFNQLRKEVEALKAEKVADAVRYSQSEREALVKQASKEGKVIALSADTIKSIDIALLRELVNNSPKGMVPTKSTMKIMSSDSKPMTVEDKQSKFLEAVGVK